MLSVDALEYLPIIDFNTCFFLCFSLPLFIFYLSSIYLLCPHFLWLAINCRVLSIDRYILSNISVSCDVWQTYANSSSWKIRFENYSEVSVSQTFGVHQCAILSFDFFDALKRVNIHLFCSLFFRSLKIQSLAVREKCK